MESYAPAEFTPRTVQTPPNSIEAERSVLGALLMDQAAVVLGMEMLTAEDFYHPQHAAIFGCMRTLYLQPRAIDIMTLDEELRRTGLLTGIGGAEYLVDLIKNVPTTVNVRHYIDIVIEKATLRRLIRAADAISQHSYQERMPVEDILLFAENAVFDIVMKRSGGEQLEHIGEAITAAYAHMEELDRNKGGISGVPTGFKDLDTLLTGLHPGELILVGARPSMGKTSFALNIATNAAHAGHSVAVFSLEMPNEQLAMRMMCSDAHVNMQSVRNGTLRNEDWKRLSESVPALASSRMYLDDSSSLSPSQLRSRCRRLKMEKGLDLIVIDYLQLMMSDGKAENRQLEVSEISRKLKGIALDLRVPVIACAQLSRANTQRAEKRPMLSDLRDSGSIEQDADVVMFLHRDNYYKENAEATNLMEVILAKQRNGPLGTVKLNWLEEYTLFTNVYKKDE